MGAAASIASKGAVSQVETPGARGRELKKQPSRLHEATPTNSWKLSSHIPRIVTSHVVENQLSTDSIPKYRMSTMDAAIVWSDISGFTKLSSYLSSTYNRNGPERMHKHLNDYFSEMVSIIALFKGDIIKFAGDALLVLWGDNQMPDESTRITAATLCAAVLVTQLNQYPVADDIMLSLHAVVDCGAAEGLHIGGVGDKWEFLVVGDFFRRLGPLIDSAAAGEVAVSAAAWRTFARQEPELGNLGRELVIEGVGNASERDGSARIINRTLAEHPAARPLWASLQSHLSPPSSTSSSPEHSAPVSPRISPVGIYNITGPNVCPSPSSVDVMSRLLKKHDLSTAQGAQSAEGPVAGITETRLSREALRALRRYVPVPVLRAVDAGSGKFMAENRRVSVVFVNLPPLEIGSLRLAQGLLEAIQRGLEEHEGMLRQFLNDDKGSVAIAVFGLPPHAGRDDALRCVEFAMKLKQELEGDVARGRAGRLEVRGQSTPRRKGGAEANDKAEGDETASEGEADTDINDGDEVEENGGFDSDRGVTVPRDFQFSAGVTTGDVYSGNVGHPLRCEYCVIGDSVNMSARLMGACMKKGGGILVDEATYLACASGYEFEPLPAIQVKGKEAPMPVYEPLRPRNVLEEDDNRLRHAVAHFVPRPSITTKLWDRVAKFAAACDGRGGEAERQDEDEDERERGREYGGDAGSVKPSPSPILLLGEPGMGKTQLLYWLCAQCEDEVKLPFLMVSCDERLASTPLSTVAKILVKVLRSSSSPSSPRHETKLHRPPALSPTRERRTNSRGIILQLLPDDQLENAHLLNYILPPDLHLDHPCCQPHRKNMSLDDRSRKMQELVYALLVACVRENHYRRCARPDSHRPKLLLVVDGVHCADSSSLAILQRLQREPSLCVMLVGAGLPGADFGEGAGALELEVGPFGEEQTEEMLRSIMDVPEEVGLGKFFEVVVEKGRGSPLLGRRFTEYLIGKGAVERRCEADGQLASVELDLGEGGVKMAEGAEFDWLDDATRSLLSTGSENLNCALKVASVLGVVFDSDLLASVHPVPSHVPLLEETLAAAVDSRLLEPMSSSSRSYRFAFDALQSAVYSLMPEEQRKALHLEVASRLQTSGDTADLVQEALHWLKAGERVNAAEAYYEAGLNAAFIGANEDVVTLLLPALDCLSSDELLLPQSRAVDLKVKVCIKLGQSYLTLGQNGVHGKSGEMYGTAIKLKDRVSDMCLIFPAMSGDVLLRWADFPHDRDRSERVQEFYEKSRGVERKTHFIRAASFKFYEHRLLHQYREGIAEFKQNIQPLYDFESMHEEMQAVYGSDWGLYSFANAAVFQVIMGDVVGAEAVMNSMAPHFEEVGHVNTRMFYFSSRAWVFWLLENPEAAVRELERANKVCPRVYQSLGRVQTDLLLLVARRQAAASSSSHSGGGDGTSGGGGEGARGEGGGEGAGSDAADAAAIKALLSDFWCGLLCSDAKSVRASLFGPEPGTLAVEHYIASGQPGVAVKAARRLLQVRWRDCPEFHRLHAEALLSLSLSLAQAGWEEEEKGGGEEETGMEVTAPDDAEWKDEQGDEPEVRSRAELLSDAVVAARRARKMAQQKGARLLELKAALTLADVAQACYRFQGAGGAGGGRQEAKEGSEMMGVETIIEDVPSRQSVKEAVEVPLQAINGAKQSPLLIRAHVMVS